MKLTPEQALQKAIEAHKAGKAKDVDQYYTAILKLTLSILMPITILVYWQLALGKYYKLFHSLKPH